MSSTESMLLMCSLSVLSIGSSSLGMLKVGLDLNSILNIVLKSITISFVQVNLNLQLANQIARLKKLMTYMFFGIIGYS